MNDAPNDSLRNYSVSEDLFQFNMLVGYKASKRWYYSTNVSFKTQFLKTTSQTPTNSKVLSCRPASSTSVSV